VAVELQGGYPGVSVKEWTPDHVTLRAGRGRR
jgi:hypothetical protein